MCNVSHMCVIHVCHIWVCDMCVSLICVSYIHMCDIVSHLSVTCMCVSIPCMCECVFMCVHMYLPQCVTGSQRTTWKRLLSFSIVWILDIISLGSSGLAASFLDLINLLPVCFSVFQIRCTEQAFILSYCLKWMFAHGITTISFFCT